MAGSVYRGDQNTMTNDECPMTKECSNDECRSPRVLTSSFELRHSFVIRHSPAAPKRREGGSFVI
jgi:hypothetical protein